MARIILYKGQSNYGSLRLHVDQLGSALRKSGHNVIIIDLMEKYSLTNLNRELNNKPDFVLGFNGIGIDLTSQGKSIYDIVNVPYIAAIVDHPHFHIERLSTKMNQLYVTCLDRSHLKFLRTYFPEKHIKGSMLWMPGGNRIISNDINVDSKEKYLDRDISILFTGTFRGEPERGWKNYAPSIKSLLDNITDKVLSSNLLSYENALETVLNELNMDLSKEQINKMNLLMPLVDSFVHAYRRYTFLEQLAQHNLNIDLYGIGWEKMKSKWSSFTFNGEGSFSDTLIKLKKAKIVLNTNYNFVDGGHERVFAAMINGAAIITDPSKVYMEEFQDKQDIFFYDWKQLDSVPANITNLLENPDELWEVAVSGQKKVLKSHTWEARAEQLIDFVELNKIIYSL
ncbi:glycosyltransferase [Ornithinibacillus contaminans]|uniref:glycosyltransferase n=1 Tax=Ornithinibacillus contaminans TaxID=694055 RepID=UPI00064DA130|nr:glycosyltransferase [Ornithinibacillus contaminans]